MKRFSWALAGCLVVVADVGAWAQSSSAAAPPGSSSAPAVSFDKLAPLPELPAIKRGEPDPESEKELDTILGRLTSEDADARERARVALDKTSATLVPAIHARIQAIRTSLDRDRAPRVIADARKAARPKKKGKSDKKKDDKASDADADGEDDDWLVFLQAKPEPDNDTWRELVHLLGMVRMLTAAGTTPAVRELLELRANFGDMLRIDLQRQIAKLKERAIPALIEAKKHDATVVQRFADTELDKLRASLPSQAVSVNDPDVLVDVLLALGRVRDVDAVDPALSFANHDRRKVREAARQAIAAIGDAGKWRLRDAYKDLTGEKPDKSMAWDVLARRIFTIYDHARVAELHELAKTGFEASKSGRHSDAIASFDKVLARDPLYERRTEMGVSYFEVARSVPLERAEERLATLRKARRLDPDGKDASRIDAEISFTEAKLLIDEGRPDRFLLERAIELDPTHEEARKLLASFEHKAVKTKESNLERYGAAGGVGVAMIGALTFLALWRRKKPARTETAPSTADKS